MTPGKLAVAVFTPQFFTGIALLLLIMSMQFSYI
jgi:hypothetical protein